MNNKLLVVSGTTVFYNKKQNILKIQLCPFSRLPSLQPKFLAQRQCFYRLSLPTAGSSSGLSRLLCTLFHLVTIAILFLSIYFVRVKSNIIKSVHNKPNIFKGFYESHMPFLGIVYIINNVHHNSFSFFTFNQDRQFKKWLFFKCLFLIVLCCICLYLTYNIITKIFKKIN